MLEDLRVAAVDSGMVWDVIAAVTVCGRFCNPGPYWSLNCPSESLGQ